MKIFENYILYFFPGYATVGRELVILSIEINFLYEQCFFQIVYVEQLRAFGLQFQTHPFLHDVSYKNLNIEYM